MKYMVVAYDSKRVIGGENVIPWQGVMPADMLHFKKLTMGQTVVMGRKTYESIGHALPFRQNIVLTRQDIAFDDAEVVHSLSHAYAAAINDVYVIGGAEVYQMALDDVGVIYATEIQTDIGGDTYFPALPAAWQEVSRESHAADERNKYAYSFVKYVKQQ